MTATGVNGDGETARSGARALSLLASPLNGTVLQKLAGGPKRLVDLRRETGSPAQTTLRAHLRELEAAGAIEKRRRDRFPGVLEYELTGSGKDLLFVVAAVEHWLREAPGGQLDFGGTEGKAAIKSLIEAWSSTMLRALAARPLSLTELDRIIAGLSYPSLERRLGAMRLTGQVEACDGNGKGTPYAPTAWLRRGIAPLAAAAQWERRHLPEDSVPIARIDVEAALLLVLPLLDLPGDLTGSCRLGVEMSDGKDRRLVGAMAHVDGGQLDGCSVRLDRDADAWVTGPTSAWLRGVIEEDTDGLELGGDQRLARALVEGLHGALFGSSAEALATHAA
ncbi:MAG TPA: winged helix-turn-helix transcriptional regulator [Solirubrobacterales bacterium]